MIKRLSLILLLLAALSGLLFSIHSDNYLLGTYSYFNASKPELLYQYISEANYNNHICAFSNLDDANQIYLKSNNNKLDVIAIDSSWEPEINLFGSYELSKANNYKYEAEYTNEHMLGTENQGSNIPDMFYYRFARDTLNGSLVQGLGIASNNHAWEYAEGDDDPDDMFGKLYWKWKIENKDKYLVKEIIWNKQETLFFDLAIKFEDLGNSDDELILIFDAYSYIDSTTTISLNPVSSNPNEYGTELTVESINNYEPNNYDFKIFTFEVDLETIDPQIIHMSDSHKNLANLQFSAVWMGKGNIYVDYIRVYDDIYEKLENGDYNEPLITEMTNISNPNLIYLYPIDEPRQPQFDAYRLVEDIVDYSTPLLTALNNKGGLNSFENYSHHRLFEHIADPEVIMVDRYPITGKRTWNTHPAVNPYTRHIQDSIQDMLSRLGR